MGERHAFYCQHASMSTLACLLIACAFLAENADVIAQSVQPRVRTIQWDIDTPIAQQLLPDDDVVIVTRTFDDFVVDVPEPTTEQVIGGAASRADVVAVVDVDDVQGVLSEQGTWIDTRVAGRVRQVLKASAANGVSREQRLEARITGGEMRIGAVTVKAGQGSPPLTPSILTHRQYLMFLIRLDGNLHPTHTPLLIVDGKLTYPWRYEMPNQRANPLEGLSVEDVVRQVRRMQN